MCPLRVVVGSIFLAATSWCSTVAYTEVAPIGVTCPTLTAAQGTCSNSASAFITSSASVSGFSTTGALVAGLRVTAVFGDGVSQTLIWAGTGGAAGGVSQASGTHQWSLSNANDTFTTPFVLTNAASSVSNITYIILSGIGGVNGAGQATIFDRTNSDDSGGTGNEQTPNSHNGHDLNITSGNNGNTYSVLVTYSAIYRVTPSNACTNSGTGSGNQRTTAPCADEWATLTIHFLPAGGGVTNFVAGSTLSFMQDADNTNGLLATPEPTTISLLGAGLLAGVFFVRRRRKIACLQPASTATNP